MAHCLPPDHELYNQQEYQERIDSMEDNADQMMTEGGKAKKRIIDSMAQPGKRVPVGFIQGCEHPV